MSHGAAKTAAGALAGPAGLVLLLVGAAALFTLALLVPLAVPAARVQASTQQNNRSTLRVWSAGAGAGASTAARLVDVTRFVAVAPARLLVPARLAHVSSGPAAMLFDATPYFGVTAGYTALSVRAGADNATLLSLHGCEARGLRAAVEAAARRASVGVGVGVLVLVPALPCGDAAVPTFNALSGWLSEVAAAGARGVLIEAPTSMPPPSEAPLMVALAAYGITAAADANDGGTPPTAALERSVFVALVAAAKNASLGLSAPLLGELVLAGDSDPNATRSALVAAAREYGAYVCLAGETLVLACIATLPLATCALAELVLGAHAVRCAQRHGLAPPLGTLVPLLVAYGGALVFALANGAQQLGLALGGDLYNLTHAHAVLGELGWLALYAAYASITAVLARSLALMHDAGGGGARQSWQRLVVPLYGAWLALLATAGAAVVAVSVALPTDALVVATALHVVALVPTAVAAAGVGVAFVVRARHASAAPQLRAALRRLVALLAAASLCFVALAALYVAQSVVRASAEARRYGTTTPCALRIAIRLVALAGAAALLVFLRAWRRSVAAQSARGDTPPTTTQPEPSSVRPRKRLTRHGASTPAPTASLPALMPSSTGSAFSADGAGSGASAADESGLSMAALPD